jgi:hypothetical protein
MKKMFLLSVALVVAWRSVAVARRWSLQTQPEPQSLP